MDAANRLATTNQQEPIQRQARQDLGHSHSFNKLSDLSKRHRPLSISELDIVNKIKKLFVKIISKIIPFKYEFETYRTQEHLLFGEGSLPNFHFSKFLKALRSCGLSENLQNQNLQNQLSRLDSNYDIYDFLSTRRFMRKMNVLAENTWIENIKENINKLAIGESMLVNIISQNHMMMMRIEKRSDNEGFNLYFANTGKGILENTDFHPVKINEDGTQEYRLVAQIQNIFNTQLLEGKFLENLIHAIDSDKINKIYSVLRNLQNENTNAKLNEIDDPRHWNRQQTMASCAASCIAATIRSVLSQEDNVLFETQMQVQALLKNYQLLKSNSDRSTTRKIMVLDLVQSLMQNSLLSNEDKEILQDIEEDVKGSLKMKAPEIMISKSSRISIDPFISEKKGKYELSPFLPVISKEKASITLEKRLNQGQRTAKLRAYLSMGNSTFASNKKYQVKKNSDNRWIGVEFHDKAALLCFHVANGDQEQIEFYMNDLLELLKNKSINEQQDHLDMILIILADQLSQLDQTRSGIAKTLFLSSLVLQQFCLRKNIDFNDVQKDLWKLNRFDRKQWNSFIADLEAKVSMTEGEKYFFTKATIAFIKAKYLYANLHVQNLLSDDNIWMTGLAAIEVRQPSVKAPSNLDIRKTINYHLEDRLQQTDPDVMTHESAINAFSQYPQ